MVSKKKVEGNTIWLSILISIILTVILVSTVNVGISLFLNEPEYTDFCDYNQPFPYKENVTMKACEEQNGTWYADGNYCDFYSKCNQAHQDALRPFEQYRFYVLAVLGFTLLLVGLFMKELLIQITGLATGGILVFQGVVTNLQEKLVVFVALLAILVVFGVLALRVIRSARK